MGIGTDGETGAVSLRERDIRAALESARPATMRREGFRDSAVLVPLLEVGGEWHLLFTKRSEDLEHHRGQVSFPGGATEEGESPEDAALRETFEEISIGPGHIHLVQRLDEIWTPSGFIITPVVGFLHSTEHLQASAAEVSRVFTVPLSFFCLPDSAEIREVHVNGFTRQVYFYHYDGETIWGATAFILRNLLQVLGLLPPDPKQPSA
jgi:8-oxo-dGTP pyrophosphatase MutT (NUDIX family)